MEFTLLDSTGNLIYQRGQQENGTHAVDSLWYLPFVALQNVLRTELDDDGITSLRDDGSLIVFRQTDLLILVLRVHDASIDDQHLYNQCQLILDYMVFTWGPEIEDLLDTHSGRQQFGIPLLKRRLDALFSVLEEGNLLCAATQSVELLQVDYQLRVYCVSLIRKALRHVNNDDIHHCLLCVGRKLLCWHSSSSQLTGKDLFMLQCRLSERLRRRTIANEWEYVYLTETQQLASKRKSSVAAVQFQKYILYLGRITPCITAVILRRIPSNINTTDSTDQTTSNNLLIPCVRLQSFLQQEGIQSATGADAILDSEQQEDNSNMPSLDQLTQFLQCKEQSHLPILAYWTMFPGLVYFVISKRQLGVSVVPLIDGDGSLYAGSNNQGAKTVDASYIRRLMRQWVSQTDRTLKETGRVESMIVRGEKRFTMSYNHFVSVCTQPSRKSIDSDVAVDCESAEIACNQQSAVTLWTLWINAVPVELVKRWTVKLASTLDMRI